MNLLNDKLMYANLVTFDDMTEDCGCDDGTMVFGCINNDVYLGYIAYDYGVGLYRFFPQIDDQQALSEVVLYNIAEKIFILNQERRLN